MEARGWILGIGMGLFAYYLPLILRLVYLAALGVLFARIRSVATGMLFFAGLFMMSAPWIARYLIRDFGAQHTLYLNIFTTLCLLLQTTGLVLYVRTIPKRIADL
ncbi:MAG: hypothetical protein BWK76_12810 [Desulfobulbaceae bacterium A2]|nr:MAG: hypothetical protein BWK76_12810 [Desulfobulbaceae bacterium A2]